MLFCLTSVIFTGHNFRFTEFFVLFCFLSQSFSVPFLTFQSLGDHLLGGLWLQVCI